MMELLSHLVVFTSESCDTSEVLNNAELFVVKVRQLYNVCCLEVLPVSPNGVRTDLFINFIY